MGRPWNEATAEAAAAALLSDFQPLSDHRGSAWYRRTTAANLLLGFWHDTHPTRAPGLGDFPSGTLLSPKVSA